jgi:hypothetical protein
MGLSALEDEIGLYEEDKANLEAELRKFKVKEYEGQSLGFAVGRISTAQQVVQDQLDFIARQENAAINKLNYKNAYIENVMKLTQQDYDNANSSYQYEFNKALQIQSQVSTEKNQIRDDARATLTTIVNNMSKSGIELTSLDPAMLANISTLELQAGAPVGSTIEFYKADPKANILFSGTDTDADGNNFYYQVDTDGNKKITYTGGVSTSGSGNLTGAEQLKADAQNVASQMEAAAGEDGYISPDDWNTFKLRWQTIYPDDSFTTRFAKFRNPANKNY